jgi:putative restriction endonuclease
MGEAYFGDEMRGVPEYLRLTRANGRAPHKPVLLLAVLKAFDEGIITENRVEPSAELINLFNGYWQALVHDDTFQRRFYLPFFHLKNERSGLWTLHTLPGFEQGLTRGRDIKSLGALIAFEAYATLRPEVYQRWRSAEHRAADRLILIAHYFNGQKLPTALPDHLHELERQIVHDSPEAYVARQLQRLQVEEEEEQVLRGAAFKRKIPELYDHRCAITGLRVQNRRAVNLIDACHIVPWVDSFDDTIGNGIALCPNMHRAFDRGLISIAPDHTVLVAADLLESASSHAIRPFAGQRLILPNDERYWPAPENLAQHRERWGY